MRALTPTHPHTHTLQYFFPLLSLILVISQNYNIPSKGVLPLKFSEGRAKTEHLGEQELATFKLDQVQK